MAQRARGARADRGVHQRLGERAARIYYIQGMLLGIVPLLALGFLAAFLISLFDALDVHDEGIRAVLRLLRRPVPRAPSSASSHGWGARRTTSRSTTRSRARGSTCSARIGRSWARSSGSRCTSSSRPPLLQIEQETKNFAFYVTVAFLAGFSERWTRVILDGAQSVIGGERPKPEVTAADAPSRPRRRTPADAGRPEPAVEESVASWPPTPTSRFRPTDVAARVAAFAPALDQVVAAEGARPQPARRLVEPEGVRRA